MQSNTREHIIGIDIGGTNLRIGVVELNNDHHTKTQQQPRLIKEIRFKADFATLCISHQNDPKVAWQAILHCIANDAKEVLLAYPKVTAIGIGFPGFIDPKTQKIRQSPNLPGLHEVDLSQDLSVLLGLPVHTENDALAAAFGEFSHYISHPNQQYVKHLAYLGLGTGVGGGIILNGQPWQGAHGVAMEVGHIITDPNGRICGCQNAGCMEQYASATGVIESYRVLTDTILSATEIAQRAHEGDIAAIEAYALAGNMLAIALAHMLKVVDVRDIVIGGGLSQAWHLMREAFNTQLQSDVIPALREPLNISISSMGDHAGVIGAAMLAHRFRKT
jgi:glucokinase